MKRQEIQLNKRATKVKRELSVQKVYKKNYLKKVVARVDFLNPIISLNSELPMEVISSIKQSFPITEPKEFITEEFQFKPDSFERTKKEKTKQWFFYAKQRDKYVCISQDYMSVTFDVYDSFESLRAPFLKILDSLFNNFNDLQGKRMGLRYINNHCCPK